MYVLQFEPLPNKHLKRKMEIHSMQWFLDKISKLTFQTRFVSDLEALDDSISLQGWHEDVNHPEEEKEGRGGILELDWTTQLTTNGFVTPHYHHRNRHEGHWAKHRHWVCQAAIMRKITIFISICNLNPKLLFGDILSTSRDQHKTWSKSGDPSWGGLDNQDHLLVWKTRDKLLPSSKQCRYRGTRSPEKLKSQVLSRRF